MKTDELRRALDDLAGDAPPVDDAYRGVSRRARAQRNRARVGSVALTIVVIAGATVGTIALRSSGKNVSVVNPSPPTRIITPTAIANLAWTRVHEPETLISRIVTANGHTYAVGSYGYAASIQELTADGRATSGYRDNIGHDQAEVNDLIGIDGALVAVGSDEHGAAAWRSTDSGNTWSAVPVQQPPPESLPADVAGEGPTVSQGPAEPASITRIFAARGGLYAVGLPTQWAVSDDCLQAVWTSTDGRAFTSAPRGTACGGTDAIDGPAGIVSLEGPDTTFGVTATGHPISTPGKTSVDAIASDDHGYVAVGTAGPNTGGADSSGAIWWSADGTSWTRVATAPAPDVPRDRFATFTGVAHSPAGWIAVGFEADPANVDATDAILWTSGDGRHWTKDRRDGGTFEQDARADGIGVTGNGFAIWGTANLSGTQTPIDPLHESFVLWLGSSTPSGAPAGIVEGTMRLVAGVAYSRGISGSLSATAADGHVVTTNVGSGGVFSADLAPGTYRIVGHSPKYEHNGRACTAPGPITLKANTVNHITLVCEGL